MTTANSRFYSLKDVNPNLGTNEMFSGEKGERILPRSRRFPSEGSGGGDFIVSHCGTTDVDDELGKRRRIKEFHF